MKSWNAVVRLNDVILQNGRVGLVCGYCGTMYPLKDAEIVPIANVFSVACRNCNADVVVSIDVVKDIHNEN